MKFIIFKRKYFQRRNLSLKSPLWDYKNRFIILSIPFFIFYFAVVMRVFFLGLEGEFSDSVRAQTHNAELSYLRGDIFDRTGMLLASNLATSSVYANPRKIKNKKKAAVLISAIMREPNATIIESLLNKRKSFVWIKRHISPKQKFALGKLGISGIHFREDEKRVYPMGNLFSHVVGYVDLDGEGRSGFEMKYNKYLKNNHSFTLSLDFRVQNIVRNVLMDTVNNYKASGGVGLVMNIKTGELLSVVSIPDFDPNEYGTAKISNMLNKAFHGVYEIGSIFKIFMMSIALDSKAVSLNDVFDISKPLSIGKFTIKDFSFHNNTTAPLEEVLYKSSNIGMAKIGLKLEGTTVKKYFKSFGFLSKIVCDDIESVKPSIPSKWSKINLAAASYGYGVAVTPLHILQAVGVIANKGIFTPASIFKKKKGYRVLNQDIASQILKMMRLVVTKGTAKRVDVAGYEVAGKTGSAEKIVDGKYSKTSNIVSFLGVFPYREPQYAVFLSIDDPKGETRKMTGGVVAAPAVKQIIKKISAVLGVEPVKTVIDQRNNAIIASSASKAPTVK